MKAALTILAALWLSTSEAQKTYESISFQMSLPQGDYKKTYPKTGTGMILGLIHQLGSKSRIGIGGEIGLLQINQKSERYEGYFRNQYHTYYVSSASYVFTIAPKLRLYYPLETKSVKIFSDLSIGMNVFNTASGISHDRERRTVIDYIFNDNYYVEDIQDSTLNHTYWALRAGFGTGAEIFMGKKKNIVLTLKLSYFYGSHVKYFTHPVVDGFQFTVTPKESRTSMLILETGFRFRIFSNQQKK